LHDATARARFLRKIAAGQPVNRLQDLNYRVQAVNDLPALLRNAQTEGPMVVVVDLESKHDDVCRAIAALKADAATQHVPIIAFAGEQAAELQAAAQKAGATLVVGATTIASYLPQLLNQALQV
jgi:CheY-like chemotaxis protein